MPFAAPVTMATLFSESHDHPPELDVWNGALTALPWLAGCRKDNRSHGTDGHVVLDPHPAEAWDVYTWLYAGDHALFQCPGGARSQEWNELVISQAYTMTGDMDEILTQPCLLQDSGGQLCQAPRMYFPDITPP